MRSLSCKRAMGIAGPGQNHKAKVTGDIHPAPPARQLLQNICAHDPDEPNARKAPVQRAQRIDRITGAQPGLDAGGDDPPVRGKGGGTAQAFGERRHAGHGFQRVAW
jgi:hypothetical protein